MKALSVINPWAHLIMYHGKTVENRTWATNYRGRILIHVSKKLLTGYKDLMIYLIRNGTLKIDTITLSEELKKIESECGMIIGSVELYDCIKGYESKWAEDGMYHWIIRNPEVFEKPIPAKGSLGLWEYEGELK